MFDTEKMEIIQTINPQGPAREIERKMCSVFGCDRSGLGGLADSDYTRKQPFSAMVCTLTYLFASATHENKQEITNFIETYRPYADFSLDWWYEYEETAVGGIIINEKQYETGEDAMEDMIQQFQRICNKCKGL